MKTELHFYHEQWSFETDDKAKVAVFSFKPGNTEHRTFICSREIEVEDVPLLTRDERLDALVGIFRDQKKKIQAAAVIAVEALDNKIQQLLAIEYKEA